MHSLRPSHLRTWLRIPRLPGKTTQAPTPPLFAWSDYIPGASRVLKPRRNNLSAGVCTSTASACSALTGRAASCVCIPASQVVSTISNASTARGRECRAYKARSHAATMECRAYKARSHAATMAEINLFRRLPALLDLPKMPVFTARHDGGRRRRYTEKERSDLIELVTAGQATVAEAAPRLGVTLSTA